MAIMVYHMIGALLGYFGAKFYGFATNASRTIAIETCMKSSAFGFLLAKLHFEAYEVRIPLAISASLMTIVGSSLSVFFRFQPLPLHEKGAKIF